MKDYCEDCGQVEWLCICEDKKMIISTFCQEQECDIDLLGIEGEYQKISNVMSYTCTKCGSEQEQQNWEEKK